jgi:hypothetical protein
LAGRYAVDLTIVANDRDIHVTADIVEVLPLSPSSLCSVERSRMYVKEQANAGAHGCRRDDRRPTAENNIVIAGRTHERDGRQGAESTY